VIYPIFQDIPSVSQSDFPNISHFSQDFSTVFSVKPLERHLHPTIDSRICSQVLDVAVPRVADQAWICKNGWAKMLGLGFPGCGEQHYDQSVREIEIEIDRKKITGSDHVELQICQTTMIFGKPPTGLRASTSPFSHPKTEQVLGNPC